MPQKRDPFPMASQQAANLASSVQGEGGGGGGAAWNAMNMTTAVATSSTGAVGAESSDASQGLVMGAGTTKKTTFADDIYAPNASSNHDEEDDDFLDRPLWETRILHSRSPYERFGLKIARSLDKLYHKLYGNDLPLSEMLRTLCLASTLFFMIGGYWTLRSLKDPILTALCGVSVIPKAKMLSVFVVLGVVSFYNHLIDSSIPKHHLFYMFGCFYFVVFCAISLLLMHPTHGLANQQPSPSRLLGWISYCAIESFGSVMVSLFWSFANSNISLATAKASYGVMVATAQVGSIIGPTIVNRYAETWGPAKCYLLGAMCMLLLQGTMYTYISIYGVQERNEACAAETAANLGKKKEKAGVLEGLHLFWKFNYVKGIFAISCLFMVAVTIVDYTLKMLARDRFSLEYPCEVGMSCYNTDIDNVDGTGEHGMSEDATAAFTAFMGFFGQVTNTLSFTFSLLGTSAVIRYLGLRWTLLLFPSMVLCVIIMVRLEPTLYVCFGAMIMLKAASYSLNNPTKEILYQPTSSAVRYKAKSWIDIFGARGSKALGSVVTNAFSDSAQNLVANGSLVGMAVASFLIWNATFMGKKFEEYTASGYIVGGDENENESNSKSDTAGSHANNYMSAEKDSELSTLQNQGEDTSCAIIEDDDQLGAEEEGQSESEEGSHNDDDDEEDDFAKKPQVQMV
jgi:ATP:ADP antiporter, AAA family